MSDSIDISLLRVPYESLKRTSRDRKYVIEDVQKLVLAVRELANSQASGQELQAIEALIGRVHELKSTLQELTGTETADAERCKARLQHLRDINDSKPGVVEWNRRRLPRILVDHLLRSGYTSTAVLLTQVAQLESLVDEHIFEEARPITQALQSKDCGPALAWCAANSAKLKKAKSKLEFRLRMQEFVELVRRGDKLKAIAHSQQFLAPWAGMYFSELQRVVASLVFGADTSCEPYKTLFEESQWGSIIDLFDQELFRLHCMTQESLLTIQLQAGLSALKSPPGSNNHESKEDPLHHKSFQTLARRLPSAKHVHSRLVCAVTKDIMDEHNPPMVLPNGTVYSERAIQSGTVNGQFTDPVSGESFPASQMRRAYIS